MTSSPSSILSVRGLTVAYGAGAPALRGASFELGAGECLAVIGRSGAGKSSLVRALTGLLGRSADLVAGAIRFADGPILDDEDFSLRRGGRAHRRWLAAFHRRLRALRGTGIFPIFQEPRAALNPHRSLRAQLAQALTRGGGDESLEELLAAVDLAPRVLDQRPDALSVGMCQRIQIAMAAALRARVVLADEPLARVDPRGRGRVLAQLRGLQERGAALMLVSHDPELVARAADQVLVLHDGRVIERGPGEAIFDAERAHHPLLQVFLEAHARVREDGRSWSLEKTTRSGEPGGCPLRDECWAEEADCAAWKPEAEARGEGLEVLCRRRSFAPGELDARARSIPGRAEGEALGEAVLVGEDLSLRYPTRGWARLKRRQEPRALEGASLTLRRGEVLAVVGESGGGKTTLAHILAGLLSPEEGRVLLLEKAGPRPMPAIGMAARRDLAWRFQVVFQEADRALDPSWSVRDSVAEAFSMNYRGLDGAEARGLAELVLDRLWLRGALLRRTAAELSGGERKRASLARALAALGWGLEGPEAPWRVLILDEPLSGLDPVVQGQCLHVLLEARRALRLSLIWISHDLPLTRAIADRIAVVYGGRLVELLTDQARHPFSRHLLDPWQDRTARPPDGPSPGCVYFAACDRTERGPRCGEQTLLPGDATAAAACWAV